MGIQATPYRSNCRQTDVISNLVTLPSIAGITHGRGWTTPGAVDKPVENTPIHKVINRTYSHAPIWFQPVPKKAALWARKEQDMPEPKSHNSVPEPRQPLAVIVETKPLPDIPKGRVSLAALVVAVSSVTGIRVSDLKSIRRHTPCVRARHIYFYAARKLTRRSLLQIGRRMGDRDHSTVIHGVEKVKANLEFFEPELSTVLAMFETSTPEQGT